MEQFRLWPQILLITGKNNLFNHIKYYLQALPQKNPVLCKISKPTKYQAFKRRSILGSICPKK